MPDQLQLRGGTTTEHNSFTGAAREVTVDTTKKTLVVHDGSQAGGTPLMKESGATAASSVQIGTGGNTAFRIHTDQKVGVGVNTPVAALDVNGVSSTSIKVRNTGTVAAIDLSIDSQQNSIYSRGTTASTGRDFRFMQGGSEKIRVATDGKVGIGTTSPSTRLTVSDTGPAIVDIHHSDGGTGDEARIILGALSANPPSNRGAGIAALNNGAGHDLLIKCSTSHTLGPSEKMRITSSGHLLFAGTSEEITLQTSDGSDNGYLNLSGGGACNQNRGAQLVLNGNERSGLLGTLQLLAGNAGSASSVIQFFTGGSEQVRIDSAGRLLLGTSAADTGAVVIDKNITAESDVSDTAGYHLVIRSQTNSNTSKVGIAFKNTSTASSVGAAILHHRTAGSSVGDLAFYTSPTDGTTTERTKITSVGTLLHGSGAISTQKATNGGLDIACNNNSIIFGADSNSGANTQTRTNNTPKDQRIAAVHYTNAEEPIGVVRVYSDSTTNQMHFGGGSSLFNAATTMYFYTAANNTTTSGTERMRINTAGSVSIGTSTNANARLFVNPRVDGTTQRGITISGRKDVYDVIALNFVHAVNNSSAGSVTFTTTAAVSYNTTSDYRLKQDVVTLTDSITRLKLLNPVHFKWKDSPSVETDGFLAHEVQTVIPSAITGEKDALDKDGNIEPQQIDTSKLTPLLTSALQEAIAKIETLETKVAALEAA